MFGIVNHLIRYGDSQIALTTVAVFWGLGSLLTLISGSVIPFLIMHDTNNFFFKLKVLFSSDIILYSTIFILIILSIAWIYLFLIRKKKNVEI